MPIMGVCDECGMLMELLPDGSCPNGHGRSSIRDTFETRAPSVNHAAFADEGGDPPAAPPAPSRAERAAEPEGAEYASDAVEEDPVVYASQVPQATAAPPASPEAAQKARRVVVTIVVAFFLLQALCACGGVIMSMVRSLFQ